MKHMSIATILVAIVGYVLIMIPSRALSEQGTVDFLAYWSLFFALTGVIDGLMQETTRATANQGASHTDNPPTAQAALVPSPPTHSHPGNGPRPIVVAITFALVGAVLIVFTGPLWGPGTIHHGSVSTAVILCAVGLASYTFQTVMMGLLSAAGRWGQVASLMTLDSLTRLAIALLAIAFGWPLLAFLVVTVFGAISWLLMLAFYPSARAVLSLRADVATPQFIRQAIISMLASGASAVLITGFPFLLRMTSPANVDAALLGGVIYAITLTRAPLLVPLQRFQSALIVYFVPRGHQLLRALSKPVAGLLAVGVVGAIAAWIIGPLLMGLLVGEKYVVPGVLLAFLTLGSATTASLMVTGSAVLAAQRHNLYLLGWVAATVVALLVLLLPFDVGTRAVAALVVGPTVGALVHTLPLLQRPFSRSTVVR